MTSLGATHASYFDRPMPFTFLCKTFPRPLRPWCHGLGRVCNGEWEGVVKC